MGLKAINPLIKAAAKTKAPYIAPKIRSISPLEFEAIERGIKKENIELITDVDAVFSLSGVSNNTMISLDELFTYTPKNFYNNIDTFFRFTHRDVLEKIKLLNDPKLIDWYKEIIGNIRKSFLLKNEIVNQNKLKDFYKLISNRKTDEITFLNKSNAQIERIIAEVFPSLKNIECRSEMIETLKNIIGSKEYAKLQDKNKFTIKIATVLSEFNDDTTLALLNKLNIPEEMKINISKMRYVHDADSLALNFVNKDELSMIKLYFKQVYKREIPEIDIKKAEELMHELDKTGISLFGTPLPKGKNLAKIPIIKGTDGYEYHVLNLNKIKGDMTQYGFPGINAEDFTIDATFVSSLREAEVVDAISRHLKSPFTRLCTSKIGLGQNRTFQDRKIGIPIEADSKRRYQFALSHDLEHSGFNYQPKVRHVLKKGCESEVQRTFISDEIKQRLNINDEQYAELFAQIEDKRYLTQIKNLTLDGRELLQSEINKVVSVIKETQSKLVNKGKTWIECSGHDYASPEWGHNETLIRGGIINKDFILYKADDFSKVDERVKKYIRKNNKYLILI